MNVVADACVAVKWYVREAGSDEARLLLDARADRIELVAPDIFVAETLNALTRKVRRGEASERQLNGAVDHLGQLAIPMVSTSSLLDRALPLAIRLDHALQDCLYLACAERTAAAFVTADDRFSRKLGPDVTTAQVVRLDDLDGLLASVTPTPI